MQVNSSPYFSAQNLKAKKQVANSKNNVAFKGTGIGSAVDKTAKSFDFKGYNIPLKAILGYTFGVVLGSRILRARDANEKREVVTRDTLAISTIIFAVPLLQKVAATVARKSTGLPIAFWSGKKGNVLSQVAGHLNPAGKYNLASSDNLANWYGKIKNRKNPLVDFCKQHDSNGGNLWKMFQFLDKDSKAAVNKIAETTKMKPAESAKNTNKWFFRLTGFLRKNSDEALIPKDNSKIIEMFGKVKSNDKNLLKLEENLNKTSKDGNELHGATEFLKSVPDLMNIGIVAGILGYALPAFNIAHTKKLYQKKKEQEMQKSVNGATPVQPSLDAQFKPKTNLSNNTKVNTDLFANFQK